MNWYRKLIRLRREHPALARGSYRSLQQVPGGIYGYLREKGKERILVLLNFTGRKKRLSLSDEIGPAEAQILLAEPGRTEPGELDRFYLDADGVLILKLAGQK